MKVHRPARLRALLAIEWFLLELSMLRAISRKPIPLAYATHSDRGRLRSWGPFLKATRPSLFFTEIVEIRILGNVEKPTDNNADQADWFISADEAREWQRQQDKNEARIRR